MGRHPLGHRVHPRVCGETIANLALADVTTGPSPRVRGNRRLTLIVRSISGSIPACAGKPGSIPHAVLRPRVHPRVCGETWGSMGRRTEATGPSPRVRGNRLRRPRPAPRSGSIPACAGKPCIPRATSGHQRVHPRVCGETSIRSSLGYSASGPSPRVRGNLLRYQFDSCLPGSIPACAGKPRRPYAVTAMHWVHPRVCGETPSRRASFRITTGPSPRVRGNPRPNPTTRSGPGSIPACAGKPSPWSPVRRPARVHPRVCGETDKRVTPEHVRQGPSPRVRGNRGRVDGDLGRDGSIPACAGKPIGTG